MSSVFSYDAANAFATIYDGLSTRHPTRANIYSWRSEGAFTSGRQSARVMLETTGVISAHLCVGTNPAELLGVATAADEVLIRAASPVAVDADDRAAIRLQARYLSTGRLDDAAVGAVLPRRRFDEDVTRPPGELRDAFGTLRVSADNFDQIVLVRPSAEADLPPDPGGEIKVASVPLLGPDQLTMESTVDEHGQQIYLAGPTSTVRDDVAPAAACLAGADLGLVPEASLDDDVLARWLAVDAAALPTWVLAGTGPVSVGGPGTSAQVGVVATTDGRPLPPNRAVLLHPARGQVVAVQDKRRHFDIPADQLKSYMLDAAPAVDHQEGIAPGSTLTVLESRAGRFAILVCEDLSRVVADGALILALGVTHLLVPILAPGIEPYRWEYTRARSFATEVGSCVVVFNSTALDQTRLDGSTARTMVVAERDRTGKTTVEEVDVAPTASTTAPNHLSARRAVLHRT